MIELTKDTFEPEVLQGEGTIFVDFYGDGCVPCEALKPFVHECAEKYGDKLKFAMINTSKARRLSMGQGIMGLPVMAIYQNGQKVEELIKDDCTPEGIEAMIQKYC